MDSLFGLSASDLADKAKGSQQYLKFIALGVIGGYAGTLVLDTLSLVIAKRVAEQQASLEQKRVQVEQDLAKIRTQLVVTTKYRELASI